MIAIEDIGGVDDFACGVAVGRGELDSTDGGGVVEGLAVDGDGLRGRFVGGKGFQLRLWRVGGLGRSICGRSRGRWFGSLSRSGLSEG